LVELLFPNQCALCGKSISPKHLICESCLESILRCGPCLAPEDFSHCRIFYYGTYEGEIRKMILSYKNKLRWRLYKLLGKLIIETVRTHAIEFNVITWVPSSFNSLEERGFDTMGLIARYVAKSLRMPIVRALDSGLRWKRRGLPRAQRESSVKGRFYALRRVPWKSVLLIDDVVTTGYTVQECAKTLKEAGAQFVNVCSVARTL